MAKKDDKKSKKKDDDKGEDSGGDKKKLVIVAVVVLAISYFMFGRGGGGAEGATTTTTTIPISEEAEGAVLDVGSLTVNLPGEPVHFARVSVAVVLVEGTDPLVVEGKFPLLLDATLTEMAKTDADTLRTVEGQDALRKALSEKAREIYNDEEEGVRLVKRVVLTELLIQ